MREHDARTIAEMAVEMKLFANEWGEIAFAVMLQSMVRDSKAMGVEVLAHRCGVAEPVAERIIYDAHRSAHLLGEAHRLLKAIADLNLADDLNRMIARRMAERRLVQTFNGGRA